MFESDSSALSKVVPRWVKLESELEQLSKVLPILIEGITRSGGMFRERLLKQLNAHYAAWILDPISLLKPPGKIQTDIGTEFPIDRTLLEERKSIYISITEFRTQGGVFEPNHLASIHYDTPILYWKSHLIDDSHCILARIAVRVFKEIANSVALGRAFSAMNLIHSMLQNRLRSKKSNMLIYIYMNQRVLKRNNSFLLGDTIDKTQEEQVQLEQFLL